MRSISVAFAVVALVFGVFFAVREEHAAEYVSKSGYDFVALDAPVVRGFALEAFAFLLERTGPVGSVVISLLIRNNRFPIVRQLAATLDDVPLFYPLFSPTASQISEATAAATQMEAQLSASELPPTPPAVEGSPFRFSTVDDYARAYRSKATTPTLVAKKILAAIIDSERRVPPLRAFTQWNETDLLQQAAASSLRFEAGVPLSIFDGVPVAVKEELDVAGYLTTAGTVFLGPHHGVAKADATSIARLRAAGALLVGKTNMHELGLGVTGWNEHHSAPRNPFNENYYPGGSSSGSAVAVASGLCPVAIGADGGGSVRIPAALCGVSGLKATFGRVSESGAFPLTWTMGHVGPIAATVRDVALAYAIMAGPDVSDRNTQLQPPVNLGGFQGGAASLKGLRVGIFTPFFNDSAVDIRDACHKTIAWLVSQGASVHEVEIPHLLAISKAHTITITSEIAASVDEFYRDHQLSLGVASRAVLALARTFTSRDYVASQKVRAMAARDMEALFRKVDVFVTPTTGLTAPPILPGDLAVGSNDLATVSHIMKYAMIANLIGNPAISVPVAYDAAGLPIGFQLMGRHWEEHILLRVADAIQAHTAPLQRKPKIFFPIL